MSRRILVLSVSLLAIAACGDKAARPASSARSSRPGASAARRHRTDAWPTYHHDQTRRGFDTIGRSLGRPHSAWTTGVDGKVYAEPLVSRGRVIVATENDTVYALDPATGRVVWSAHLGTDRKSVV